MLQPKPDIPQGEIDSFCQRWRIAELSLFGSAVRGNFTPASDVDILVAFRPGVRWSLYEWVDMVDEVKDIFGREVDLVERSGLRNPYRKHAILTTREVIYAA